MNKSGLIPREFIDDILARLDIVELIDSYVPLKKRGNNFWACCPFHNEKTASFSVTPVKQFYHCFSCGVSGNAISFIMAYRNLDFMAAIKELAARLGLQLPNPQQPNITTKAATNYYHLLQNVCQYYIQQLKQHPQASTAVNYLKQRGLSGEIAKQYLIGYAPPGWDNLLKNFPQNKPTLLATGMIVEKEQQKFYDRYRNRVMFPIHDRRGRIIGFGGRVLDEIDQPKYLNSPETTIFHKSRELYGLYQVISHNPRPEVILIVEGYLDVIALAQYQINFAVATLGTATSKEHIQLLSRYTRQIVFCFDGDFAGRNAAWKALENSLGNLDGKLDLRFMFLPESDDPDSLIRKEGNELFKERIMQAVSLANFFFDHLSEGLDTSQIGGRSKLVDLATPYLQKLPSGSYRQLMLEQLARLVRIEPVRLEQLIYQENSTSFQGQQGSSSGQTKFRVPSNIRLVLSLLVQNPELIKIIADEINLAALENKEVRPLKLLIELLLDNSSLNTAMVIEHFREHEYFELINKLACVAIHIPTNGIEAELRGALQQIQQQSMNQHISKLLRKANHNSLSDAEKQELLKMIKQVKLG